MKIAAISIVALCAVSAARSETAAAKPVFRDAATHEELADIRRVASARNPVKEYTPAQGEDPSVANRPADLLSQSDIICFGGFATLVPKRALLHVPAEMKQRLEMQPGAQLCTWSDFFARNRGWIMTVEVTRRQAEGNAALQEETMETISKSRQLIVATYQGGPISVLPLKEPETKPDESAAQPQTASSR